MTNTEKLKIHKKVARMKSLQFIIMILAILTVSFEAAGQRASELKYHDVKELNLPVIGRGFANCIPALRQYLDYPHIAGIACPKPTLFINGTKDKLFMTPGVEKAFKIMRDIWKSQNAGDCLYTELWPITHSCGVKVQNRILEFLNKHLSQANK